VPEHAMEDLQFGDALLGHVILHPAEVLVLQDILLEEITRRDPSVSLAKHSNEEDRGAGATAIDLLEADTKGLAALALFLGDPPAEVDLEKLHKACLTAAAKLGEDSFHQFIPLPHEVTEGRADENADKSGCGHSKKSSE
jgi:hypothetical protein